MRVTVLSVPQTEWAQDTDTSEKQFFDFADRHGRVRTAMAASRHFGGVPPCSALPGDTIDIEGCWHPGGLFVTDPVRTWGMEPDDPPETVEVIVLSQPAVLDWDDAPSYWIFEMHVLDDGVRARHPHADRAVRYLAPGEAPPEARTGERCLLTGRWQGDKTLTIDRLERPAP